MHVLVHVIRDRAVYHEHLHHPLVVLHCTHLGNRIMDLRVKVPAKRKDQRYICYMLYIHNSLKRCFLQRFNSSHRILVSWKRFCIFEKIFIKWHKSCKCLLNVTSIISHVNWCPSDWNMASRLCMYILYWSMFIKV